MARPLCGRQGGSERAGRTRSIGRRISLGDEPLAGHDDPLIASGFNALDASGAGEKISLADFALAIAPADERDVVAGAEHDVAPQDRPWPADRPGLVQRDSAEPGTDGWLRRRALRGRRGRGDFLLGPVDTGRESGRRGAGLAIDPLG